MSWRNTTTRYGWLAGSLHWLTLLLVVAAYASMELRGFFPRGSATREAMKSWHYVLGISILVLTLLRLTVFLASPAPADSADAAKWQRAGAKWTKLALYCFLLAMPLLGWLLLSAEGGHVAFASIQFPGLVAQDKGLAGLFEELHEAGATIGYFLVGLHATAALYHHYRLRDDTLQRMLPWRP